MGTSVDEEPAGMCRIAPIPSKGYGSSIDCTSASKHGDLVELDQESVARHASGDALGFDRDALFTCVWIESGVG